MELKQDGLEETEIARVFKAQLVELQLKLGSYRASMIDQGKSFCIPSQVPAARVRSMAGFMLSVPHVHELSCIRALAVRSLTHVYSGNYTDESASSYYSALLVTRRENNEMTEE